jgi:hypothetical protein
MTAILSKKNISSASVDSSQASESETLRLLDIFDRLESGDIDEDQAVEALKRRRDRRHGRFGRILEALAS